MRLKVLVVGICFLFLISFVCADVPGDCLDSMVSYWKFDESPGSDVAVDLVGSNNGNVMEGATFGSGKINNSLSLSSSKEYVLVSYNSNLNTSNSLTIELWLNRAPGPPFERKILEKFEDYNISVAGGGEIKINIDGKVIEAGRTIPPNADNFIVVTWDGSEVKIYINGDEDVSTSLSPVTYGDNDLIIGEGFIGLIDELAIYNEALTPAQIRTHFRNSDKGTDYCSEPTGATSDTKTDFSFEGCDMTGVAGWTGGRLTVGGCFNGLWHCESVGELYYTLEAGCDMEGEYCCPSTHLCDEGAGGGGVCELREYDCSHWTSSGDCEDYGECIWFDNKCYNPTDDALGCSIYKNEPDCERDDWNRGRDGAGTAGRCKTYTGAGYIIQEACECTWDEEDEKCFLEYTSSEHRYIDDDFNLSCRKFFTTGICEGGQQLVNWSVKTIPAMLSAPPVDSGLIGAGMDTDVYMDMRRRDMGCINGSTIRSCGQPIVKVPGFSFINIFMVLAGLGIFYFLIRKDFG